MMFCSYCFCLKFHFNQKKFFFLSYNIAVCVHVCYSQTNDFNVELSLYIPVLTKPFSHLCSHLIYTYIDITVQGGHSPGNQGNIREKHFHKKVREIHEKLF